MTSRTWNQKTRVWWTKLAQMETVEAELDWDSELKDKLNKNGLKKVDVARFVDAALLMKERGYDIFETGEKFSKFEKIEEACAVVEVKKVNEELRHDQLFGEKQDLEVKISQNSLKLRELGSLVALGFGLAEFRMLRDIITEVGDESGIFGDKAVKNFIKDLQNLYTYAWERGF